MPCGEAGTDGLGSVRYSDSSGKAAFAVSVVPTPFGAGQRIR
jgi:hypothetical protein